MKHTRHKQIKKKKKPRTARKAGMKSGLGNMQRYDNDVFTIEICFGQVKDTRILNILFCDPNYRTKTFLHFHMRHTFPMQLVIK